MRDNYGLATISTTDEAKDAWESFFGRFFSSEVPTAVDVTFDPELRQFTPRTAKDAKYKHPGFRDKTTKKFPIDKDRTLHSDDFDDFLNGNTVTIPEHITLNEEGLDEVAKAINDGDFKHEALKKEDHTFYALWLFKQNKITRQQMTTILARAQIPTEYPLVATFHIFDDGGKFTKEAKELWLPSVKKSWYGNDFTEEKLERLFLLISTAPKSEQTFFISKANPNIVSPNKRELGNALQTNNAWHRVKYNAWSETKDNTEEYDLHFSFGVIEALQIAKRGINGAAASRAKLGKVGIDAVQEGIEFYYRPTAISIPESGVETPTKGIHGYDDSPMPAVTAHDTFHSNIHSTIRPEFHMMFNHLNQIISKHTKQKWSKTMWKLVDREFYDFQEQEIKLDPKNGAKLFVTMLHRNNIDVAHIFRRRALFELSDDGFAMVWNMVKERDVWKKLYKIDIDALEPPYQKFIEEMRSFKEAMDNTQEQSSELLTLKYRYFRVTSNTEFQRISSLLDALETQLILAKDQKVTDKDQKLVFGKYAKGNDKNLTILKFKNFGKEQLVHENSVKKLIPTLVNMHLISIFGEKKDEAVQNELKNISAEFKSTHQNSKFSKELLEQSIIKLPSLTAKLDFLETCYEEIIHSKGYTQRHANADIVFRFFKNPLTTSQRNHVALLKEKLNELVSEYQQDNKLNNKQIKELEWYMEHRGSNLSLCNTRRFYLHTDTTVPSAKM
jgi:hypothetical protein